MKRRIVTAYARLALFMLLLAQGGCGVKGPDMPPQPDRAADVARPTEPPKTWEEWRDIASQLDEARASNIRKDAELKAAIEAKNTANAAVWKQLGAYSWMCMGPGIAILIASFLPFGIGAFFAPFRSVAFVLIGLGVLLAIAPHVLATYGPIAFYPMAVAGGLYVVCIAAIDIHARWKRNRAKAECAVVALDPSRPDINAPQLVERMAEVDPMFAKALHKAQVKAMPPT